MLKPVKRPKTPKKWHELKPSQKVFRKTKHILKTPKKTMRKTSYKLSLVKQRIIANLLKKKLILLPPSKRKAMQNILIRPKTETHDKKGALHNYKIRQYKRKIKEQDRIMTKLGKNKNATLEDVTNPIIRMLQLGRKAASKQEKFVEERVETVGDTARAFQHQKFDYYPIIQEKKRLEKQIQFYKKSRTKMERQIQKLQKAIKNYQKNPTEQLEKKLLKEVESALNLMGTPK